MPTEQVVIQFDADVSGLKPLIEALKQTGALTEAQAKSFLDLEKKQQEQITKTTEQVKAQNSELGKLTDSIKNVGQGVAGGALKQASESFLKLDQRANKLAGSLVDLMAAGKGNSAEFKKLIKDLYETEGQLRGVDVSTEKLTGRTEKLTTKLRNMRDQLAQLDEGSAEFQKLAIEAAKLEDQIGDVNERVRVMASDTFAFDAMVDGIRGITAAFTFAHSAAALFGEENEDLQRALLKVQAATGLLVSVQEISNQLTGQGAAKLAILSAAKKVYTFVTGAATAATTAFRVALISLGIGAVFAVLGAIVAYWEDISKFIGIAKEEAKSFEETIEELFQKNNSAIDSIKSRFTIAEKSTRDLKKELDRLNEALEETARKRNLEITLPNGQTIRQDMTKVKNEIIKKIKEIEDELERRKPKIQVEYEINPQQVEEAIAQQIPPQKIQIEAEIVTVADADTSSIDRERQRLDDLRHLAIESSQITSDTIFQITSQRRQAEFDAELSNLEAQKEAELAAAGDNANKRQAIEEKYARKTAEIKKKQFIADKQAKTVEAIINTGLAVIKALPNVVLAALAAAAGAAQIAIIQSQPVPQFAKGTKSAPEGFALVGEEGPELVHLSRGSKVITHPETQNFLNGRNISDIVAKYGIGQVNPAVLKIASDSQKFADFDYKRLGEEISRHKSITQINIDENGFETKIQKGNTERTYMNKRHSIG